MKNILQDMDTIVPEADAFSPKVVLTLQTCLCYS